MPSDYSFDAPHGYRVDSVKYDKHRHYPCISFRYVPALSERLDAMQKWGLPDAKLWRELFVGNSRPMVRVDARNFEEPYTQATVHFLADTGADISVLTADTADLLRIDRGPGGGPIKVTGIGGTAFAGLPRWIYVFLGGKLHPLPVLVPPEDDHIGGVKALRLKHDLLGRAGVTNCFLLCLDNKRLYSFPRRASEPGTG